MISTKKSMNFKDNQIVIMRLRHLSKSLLDTISLPLIFSLLIAFISNNHPSLTI